VDSADFYRNFDAIQQGPQVGSFPQLLVEQIEYANVVILNKSDLVETASLTRITEQVASLNPTAKVLASNNSRIDVMEVVNTQLYKAADFDKFHKLMPEILEVEVKSCCKEKVAKGETPCCLRKRTVDSGISKVFLAPGTSGDTRHATRFGITSFLYKARRPFHPNRLQDNFASKFFIVDDPEELRPESEPSQGDKNDTKGDKDTQQDAPKEKRVDPADRKAKSFAELTKQCEDAYAPAEIAAYWETMTPPRDWRKEASEKEALRTKHFGALFRSKGFMWYANYNEGKSVWNHAGNLAKISHGGLWTVLEAKAWVGTKQEQAELRKDWVEPWGDRRQDLVFIGKDLDHKAIQEALDGCLLNDDELARGIDYWRATMGDAGLKATVRAVAMLG
jgi:G3E family GTPase